MSSGFHRPYQVKVTNEEHLENRKDLMPHCSRESNDLNLTGCEFHKGGAASWKLQDNGIEAGKWDVTKGSLIKI